MALPLITIAIPAYKAEFIQEAVKSALSQTYSNIEVLVVDDCSPENIYDRVVVFNDSRLRYVRNEANVGKEDPSKNWNRCLKYAKGEYICVLCDDDLYAENYVEELVRLSEKYPLCNVFRCSVTETDEDGEVTDFFPLAPEYEPVDEYIWHLHSGNNRQTLSEWMMRTSALRLIGGYVNSPMAWGADCMTVYKLAVSGGVVSSPLRLMCFRKSGLNITGREKSYIPQKIVGWQMQCDCAREIIENGAVENKRIILRTIEHDRKTWTKNLAKRASCSELIHMYSDKDKYGFSLKLLFKGLWYKI